MTIQDLRDEIDEKVEDLKIQFQEINIEVPDYEDEELEENNE